MGLVNSLEKRLGWLSFPSLLRGLAIIQFVMILAMMFQPSLGIAMIFDWPAICKGEVWRVISFVFLPALPASFSPFGLIFAFFALMIAFLINDTLESAWGVWRTSVFIYAVILGEIIGNISIALLGEIPFPIGGVFLHLAAFFAFATLVPNYTFLLFFVLPVKVWILAAISGVLMVFKLFAFPHGIFILLTFLPYLIWAVPIAFKSSRQKGKVAKRRVDFQSKMKSGDLDAFHLCAKCGATERSHSDRDFRVANDGSEICSVCLEEN